MLTRLHAQAETIQTMSLPQPDMPAAPLVRARGLTKLYDHHRAVDAIDFRIPRGRCFGFLGPNGAGKTTTLRMLMGLTPMSAGELTVFDLPLPAAAREVRRRVGIVPQADNLDPDFSVEENLQVYASYFGLGGADTEARIQRLLEFAALTERRRAKTETLSGGMKRRLTIARALINDPELVILDEPTTGLDPQARHIIWGRLMELRRRGTTLVLTTHYMEEAERLCDELVIMDQGRILDQGTANELIQRHVEPEVIEIRGRGELLERLQPEPDCRIEQMGTSLYCYTHSSRDLMQRLQSDPELTFMHRPAGLEDVFLKLTGRELRD
ncbi:ATP-binding cassette domain-containing protein [Thiohalobacter sp. COW1]|uniref:ATP-binding cassette domain-containing protein n=1 Tax=Thiohalobacter sp. COW1 TaxID=2795687 RepID=UPI001F5B4327|nr:ATP-binding cassette domain-containing protein [Thiohalobacter sp. COW1]